MDSLSSYVTNKSLSTTELIRKTGDRKKWRAMTADVRRLKKPKYIFDVLLNGTYTASAIVTLEAVE